MNFKKLDSEKQIEKYDKGDILASIGLLPDQMDEMWRTVSKMKIPKKCFDIDNIVVAGMGGSALGGRIVDSLLTQKVTVPMEIFTSYKLPKYVGKRTLVIASSYSGNTAETLSMAKEALNKSAKVVGITTGGKLEKLLSEQSAPCLKISAKSNPSAQPRLGIGYSIASTIAILARCGFLEVSEDAFYELVVKAREYVKKYNADVSISKNKAKKIAKMLYKKIPIIISSSHLVGATHAFKNQLNESAKTFSVLFDLPELNHHLLEGLKHPKKARGALFFLLIDSDLYHPRIAKRLHLTADVIHQNSHKYYIHRVNSDSNLKQIVEVIILGSYISFYLAYLYSEDAIAIPWVDYFKSKMA